MSDKPVTHLPLMIFVLGWWSCFLLYPLWYVPAAGGWTRPLLCGALFLVLAGCAFLFRWMARQVAREEDREANPPDRRFWWILISGVSLLHIPFLNQPILSGLDMIDHASVPALVASRAMRMVSGRLGFSLQPWLMGLALPAAALYLMRRPVRESCRDGLNRLAESCTQRLGWWLL